jgi:uncharacterized protein (TIGR02246 family)
MRRASQAFARLGEPCDIGRYGCGLFLKTRRARRPLIFKTIARDAAVTESPRVDEKTRSAIAALVAAEEDAWNRGSAEAFAERALPDVVFTNVVGMFSVGKAPFVAQHEHIFSTIYKGSTIRQQVVHITLLKPDVAIVDTLSVVSGAPHVPPGIQLIDGALNRSFHY